VSGHYVPGLDAGWCERRALRTYTSAGARYNPPLLYVPDVARTAMVPSFPPDLDRAARRTHGRAPPAGGDTAVADPVRPSPTGRRSRMSSTQLSSTHATPARSRRSLRAPLSHAGRCIRLMKGAAADPRRPRSPHAAPDDRNGVATGPVGACCAVAQRFQFSAEALSAEALGDRFSQAFATPPSSSRQWAGWEPLLTWDSRGSASNRRESIAPAEKERLSRRRSEGSSA
jgi:hypothetical protein